MLTEVFKKEVSQSLQFWKRLIKMCVYTHADSQQQQVSQDT